MANAAFATKRALAPDVTSERVSLDAVASFLVLLVALHATPGEPVCRRGSSK